MDKTIVQDDITSAQQIIDAANELIFLSNQEINHLTNEISVVQLYIGYAESALAKLGQYLDGILTSFAQCPD
ncbi:MAG: hypothetical protein NUW37_15350 [Planctomycetes bacterium]|nr:hypothetical protein [Planctomycetota bacterium]